MKANHDPGGEYSNSQRELAQRIDQPGILDDLDADTYAMLRRYRQAAYKEVPPVY